MATRSKMDDQADKLYPPKCAKCGASITKEELDNGRAKFNYIPDSEFTKEQIWHEHNYDCLKIKREFEDAQ